MQEADALFNLFTLVDAGAVQRDAAGGGRGESRRPVAGLVFEPAAVRVLTFFDIFRAFARGVRGDGDPRVARCPQSHDLADRHRQIGVPRAGLVAPAAFGILRTDDQLDRSTQRSTQFGT